MSEGKPMTWTDEELLYSATARCRCGAGLAYPLDHDEAMKIRAWCCSFVMKSEGSKVTDQTQHAFAGKSNEPRPGEHDAFPFAFFKIREETSVNNAGGHSTRPPGTIARTVGKSKCLKCDHEWQSEPYDACGKSHWRSGPCPSCGNVVGTYDERGRYQNGIDDSGCMRGDLPRVETRYLDVVITDERTRA